ncbi:DUF4450 domain-containing protein [Parabacteroides sp. FAFU027]|uniref:DUF4450 domain-containing protein n=1 Tax=Parabacteroides sp. FAFU027 TaxID=2922715 RepID=UPI001FB00D86|nr:DUF4450 domain-containing protein [Parabacteroides sp. FAFU027]
MIFPKFRSLLLLGLLPLTVTAQTQKDVVFDPELNQFITKTIEPQQRTLRYRPEGQDFVIVNGHRKYNRALYGTNTGFRVETGDVPEFGLYMPNMGGHFHFGLMAGEKQIWLSQAKRIESRYRAGSRIYTITDPMLGNGKIIITALALGNAEGMILKTEFINAPKNAELVWVYGGASNKRFSREGDLGVDPEDAFDLKPENCPNNLYDVNKNRFNLWYGTAKELVEAARKGENTSNADAKKRPRQMCGIFPTGSELKIGDASHLENPTSLWKAAASEAHPVIAGKKAVKGNQTLYFTIYNPASNADIEANDLAALFNQAETARKKIANRIKTLTPDPFFNTLGGVLATAGDAIWEPESYLHGAVGWRMRLNGWRGPYTGDVLGWHDRARGHFDGYAASQVTNVPQIYNHPQQDTALNLARSIKKWGTPMYSNGYICRNPNQNNVMHHYDMNLCYIDELLWHFNWTGDMAYVEKMWPVLERHLDWEKRNFDPDNDGLYDAYCCIWASDALQYSGGGVTHSSAYNYRANKMAAEIARKLGKDGSKYEQEAQKTLNALNNRLWLKNEGHWAEFIDLMGNKLVHPSAGLWTVYHAIDSNTGNPFQNYQAIRYVENEIPHIPVEAKGIRNDGYATVSTSNWMPYAWSINNVAFAEVYHTALSYWQSGRNDQAFKLMKSAILDGMYLGNSPGNVGQISHYDAARGECYRDFGDPVGMASRAIIQGLYGILPDAMNDRIVIRPGFPTRWLSTSVSTPDVDFAFSRKNKTDEYRINLRFPKPLALTLNLRAPFSQVAKVLVNGKQTTWKADSSAVGAPVIQVDCAKANRYLVQIEWTGNAITPQPIEESIALGETFTLENKNIQSVYDPQEVLKGLHKTAAGWQGIVGGTTGHRTLFAQMKEGELSWWMPVDLWVKQPVEILVSNPDSTTLAVKLKNNTGKKYFGTLTVNPGSTNYNTAVQILPGATSGVISIPLENTIKGSNKLTLSNGFNTASETTIQCWNISNLPKSQMETVDLSAVLNDSVTHIFKNEYLSPRSPYTTLQIPKQGIGEWTHPNATAHIDDSGLRKLAVNNLFTTPEGLSFATPSAKGTKNIAFTSLWDNYPKQLSVPLTGKASHIYLLMAGSTNYMQSRLTNGEVKVYYTDGTFDKLDLVNPESWCPIEQDYFTDGKAFYQNAPHPYRVLLKSGKVSRNPGVELGLKNITREIDGGAAIILDLPLDNSKTLQKLEWKTDAYEVIIGMMGATLIR